jgi:hypothetical protein
VKRIKDSPRAEREQQKKCRWPSPIRGSWVPHRLRKAISKKGCKLGNGGWVRRGPQPQLGGMRRQRPTPDASQVTESGSVRGWRRGSQGKTPTHEGLCNRTTSKMRGLSPKIISGDSRRSENAQTHTNKHTIPNMKFKLKLLQIKCHVLGFTKDKA